MLFLVKKIFFKFMELGLGLKPCFLLETKNPIFINFKLNEEEVKKVANTLPKGFSLEAVTFTSEETAKNYWLSYNLYEIKYPKKELAHIKKVRCEINTFVKDATGKKGIFVFSGSPFVSKEMKPSIIGIITDLAERLVMWIYGVGRLIDLKYLLTDKNLIVNYSRKDQSCNLECEINSESETVQLSKDYILYNDVSFFNSGKTYDLVNTNSAFSLAQFNTINTSNLKNVAIQNSFLSRNPDSIYYYRGEISYLVSALNLTPKESFI